MLGTKGKVKLSMFRSTLLWTPLDVICTTSVQMLLFKKKKKKRKSCFELVSVCNKASGIVWPLDVKKSN